MTCANISNLLLARATGRSRETGIRISLGATTARLVRQHLVESLVLAAAAAQRVSSRVLDEHVPGAIRLWTNW